MISALSLRSGVSAVKRLGILGQPKPLEIPRSDYTIELNHEDTKTLNQKENINEFFCKILLWAFVSWCLILRVISVASEFLHSHELIGSRW
jgi:hypothetical protein